MQTLTIKDVQRMMGVGRRTAENYARSSGALLPRVKGGEYRLRKEAFEAWAKGGPKE